MLFAYGTEPSQSGLPTAIIAGVVVAIVVVAAIIVVVVVFIRRRRRLVNIPKNLNYLFWIMVTLVLCKRHAELIN